MNRFLSLFVILLLVSAGAWSKAKEKYDPQTLIEKSDAAYYYPSLQGVTDMAVDLVVPKWADSALKDVKISYYYAGENRQQFDIANLPEKFADQRAQLLEQLGPYTNFLVPSTAANSFKGLKVKSEIVYRQFIDDPETLFYQLVGTSPDKNAEVKELRVLLDKQGLMHQMESVPKEGPSVIMGVKNTRTGEKWQISRLITRLLTEKDPLWQVVNIEYGMVDGKYSLPSRVSGEQCDSVNQPVEGGNLVVQFQNYRINKGVAAAFLPPAKTVPAVPIPAPAAPVKK